MRDYRNILEEQNAGLRRRIDVLEEENRRLREAVAYTVRTLDHCRDPQANPLAKMCDRATAEKMLRDLMPGEQTPNAFIVLPKGMVLAADRCPCDDRGTYPVCRAVPHFPDCPKYQQPRQPQEDQ